MVRRRTIESVLNALRGVLSTTQCSTAKLSDRNTHTLHGSSYATISKSLLEDTIAQLEAILPRRDDAEDKRIPSDSKTDD